MSAEISRLIKGSLVVIMMALMSFPILASPVSYWILNSSKDNYRHFMQIKHENGLFKVIELDQQRGDYPHILSSQQFQNKLQLEEFLTPFLAFKTQESSSLVNWQVEAEFDLLDLDRDKDKKSHGNTYSHQKALGFGHHNKNLWPVTEQWSEQWEEKYAKWIEENVKEDFFQKYGISTDCADAVLGVRWIFSRINGLPVGNHISVTDTLFTNYSVLRNWRKIPKAEKWYNDELFKTALSYVMDLAGTRTLKKDTYPVALTKEGLGVGSIVLTESNESNHAKLISENHFDDPTDLPLFTLASTVPRKIRLLVREVVTDQGWPRPNQKTFLKFRWPVAQNRTISLKSSASHSDYSLEQYSDRLKTEHPIFIEFLLGRLKETYDPKRLISMALEDIVNYVKQRIKVVNEGAAFCASHDCSPGTVNWDDWSTPSRDEKLKAKFTNIDLLTSQFENYSPGLVEKWIDAQIETRVSILEYNLSLKTIRYLMESGKASSDPSLSADQRWGVDLHTSSDDLVSSTMDLLVKRKEIIESQNESCSPRDCYPKTTKWLMWNTFKVDEMLLAKYQEFKKICEIYGKDICFDVIFNQSLSFNSGTEILALKSWIEKIPFFYSNLDVSKERRWGKLGKKDRAQLLQYKKSMTFSDISTALIDGKRLVDLETGVDLYRSLETETLFLAKNGDLLIMADKGSLSVLKSASFGQTQVKLNLDPFSSLNDMDLKVTHFESTDKLKVLFFSSQEGAKIYALVYNAQGKVLYGPTFALSSQDRSLIFLPKKNKLIALTSEQNDKSTYDLGSYREVLDNMKMKVDYLTPLSSDQDKVLFNYEDENYGVTYPVFFYKNKIVPLGLTQTKNVKLKYFDLDDEVFFLEYLDSEEYPKALVATLINQSPNYEIVGNSFSQMRKNGKIYYFSTITGSVWDQKIIPVFKKLEDGIISSFEGIKSQLNLSHLGKRGYFSRGKDVFSRGDFLSFDGATHEYVAYSSYLRADEDLCENTYANNSEYIEQLNYQHGDYSCFGSTYTDEFKGKAIFSIKYRTDKKTFNNLFNYKSQRLESLGPNSLIWWSKKYNL